MACNATRIELSNSATTTVQITIATWTAGDAELSVTLEVDGLGIDETATTSSGVATLTIAAVSASNNAIYDATLQVGAYPPAVAEVLVTETNVAQTIGLTIDDTDVSYCAPTGGGGGPEPIPLNADSNFYFDQKVGYEEGTTAAFVLGDSYNTYVSPADLPFTFDVLGETKNITTVSAMSFWTRSFVPANQNFPEQGTYDFASIIRVPDLMSPSQGYRAFSTVSVAGHSGLYVESIRTPFRDGADDIQTSPSYFNYVKELRNHELNACVAAIDLLASAGIDGGTF